MNSIVILVKAYLQLRSQRSLLPVSTEREREPGNEVERTYFLCIKLFYPPLEVLEVYPTSHQVTPASGPEGLP